MSGRTGLECDQTSTPRYELFLEKKLCPTDQPPNQNRLTLGFIRREVTFPKRVGSRVGMGHESYLHMFKLNTVAGSGLFDGACDRKPGARIRVSSESEPLEFGTEANTN